MIKEGEKEEEERKRCSKMSGENKFDWKNKG